MGVPSFFKWLVNTWPWLARRAQGAYSPDIGLGFDWSASNPDGVEIDCLYVDLNGIIHPCFHPEHGKLPSSEAEIFRNIEIYLEHVIALARPRRLLFIAIDGVAPRAKLNQQRARRFQAAKEHLDTLAVENELRARSGLTPVQENSEEWESIRDYNVISPGTCFMSRLSAHLRRWLTSQMETNLKHLLVIFSDSSEPGEGEHKLARFIRSQQREPNCGPGQLTHCFYGADADLIFLSLLTHEPKFFIMREDVQRGGRQDCPGKQLFSLVNIGQLRLMLWKTARSRLDRSVLQRTNVERIIDDFSLLCVLCGNDFLPNLPSISIRDGDIGYVLMETYFEALSQSSGHIIESQKIYYAGLLPVLQRVAESEYLRLCWKEQEMQQICQRTLLKIDGLLQPLKSKTKQGAQLRAPTEDEQAELHRRASDAVKLGCRDNFKELSDLSAFPKGWQRRYYESKLGSLGAVNGLLPEYARGLDFVWKYYTSGCPSWQWFYKYNYAPLAADLYDYLRRGFSPAPHKFPGTPFTPFLQLLAILPPASSHALPQSYRNLMSSPTLKKFYPSDWVLDQGHHYWKWQSAVLLPFVEERLLCDAVKRLTLSEEEVERNTERLFSLLICYQSFAPVSRLLADLPALIDLHQAKVRLAAVPFVKPGKIALPQPPSASTESEAKKASKQSSSVVPDEVSPTSKPSAEKSAGSVSSNSTTPVSKPSSVKKIWKPVCTEVQPSSEESLAADALVSDTSKISSPNPSNCLAQILANVVVQQPADTLVVSSFLVNDDCQKSAKDAAPIEQLHSEQIAQSVDPEYLAGKQEGSVPHSSILKHTVSTETRNGCSVPDHPVNQEGGNKLVPIPFPTADALDHTKLGNRDAAPTQTNDVVDVVTAPCDEAAAKTEDLPAVVRATGDDTESLQASDRKAPEQLPLGNGKGVLLDPEDDDLLSEAMGPDSGSNIFPSDFTVNDADSTLKLVDCECTDLEADSAASSCTIVPVGVMGTSVSSALPLTSSQDPFLLGIIESPAIADGAKVLVAKFKVLDGAGVPGGRELLRVIPKPVPQEAPSTAPQPVVSINSARRGAQHEQRHANTNPVTGPVPSARQQGRPKHAGAVVTAAAPTRIPEIRRVTELMGQLRVQVSTPAGTANPNSQHRQPPIRHDVRAGNAGQAPANRNPASLWSDDAVAVAPARNAMRREAPHPVQRLAQQQYPLPSQLPLAAPVHPSSQQFGPQVAHPVTHTASTYPAQSSVPLVISTGTVMVPSPHVPSQVSNARFRQPRSGGNRLRAEAPAFRPGASGGYVGGLWIPKPQ
eukprot:RCo015908